jgi:hypothetical protein
MNRSFFVVTAFFAVATLLFFACSNTNLAPGPTDRVTLALNQSARLSTGITIKVDSLADGRCPVNLTCIWAGNARLIALLSKGAEQKAVRLVLGPDPVNAANKRPDSTGVVFGGITYKVVLRDVVPYPGSGQARPTEAIVQVTSL